MRKGMGTVAIQGDVVAENHPAIMEWIDKWFGRQPYA
jgi:hypothetical protein